MADWYVSSAAYSSIATFAASHAYSIGDIVKPTSPAAGAKYAFRCTTAGTSSTEPTWPTGNNSTITTGGATFTNVTSQSTYGWGAAAGDLWTLAVAKGNRPANGDRIFLSSDHSDTITPGASITYAFGTAAYALIQIISVSRAGSVPPVAADITSGAAITITLSAAQQLILDCLTDIFWQGLTITFAGTATNSLLGLASSGTKGHYFKNCAFVISATGTTVRIGNGRAIFDNTTVQFGNVSQFIGAIGGTPFELTWLNTSSAIQGATIPTNLFSATATGQLNVVCRGVDLSATSGTLVLLSAVFNKVLFDSCKIASGVTRISTPSSGFTIGDEVELVNCYDGTNTISERYTDAGTVTVDRSTTLSGGAQDDIGNYSLKLASSTRSDKFVFPLDCFWLDVENTLSGASKTATVEIISSGSLNNDDISLLLEYMGTSGSSLASFVSSLPATVLTTASALTSSSNTWNSPPSTPQKQLLQVTFTPQVAGRVRGLVRLGKASTTVWVDPQIIIT